jgi:hypothetical protein
MPRQISLHVIVILSSVALVALAETHDWPGRRWQSWLATCLPPPARQATPPPRARPVFRPELALGEAVYLCWQIGERPAGSAGERRAAAHLAQRLTLMGYATQLQDGLPLPGGRHTCNVVATRPGPPRSPTVLVGAHYDAVAGAGCRGANDNASGVGVVLELARILAAVPLPYTLQIVYFGAEEAGSGGIWGVGSRHYVRQARRAGTLPAVMVAVDMVGRGNQLYAWRLQPAPRRLERLLQHSATRTKVRLQCRQGRGASDHWSFTAAGVPAVWLQRLPDAANHTPADRPENLSAEALGEVGRLLSDWLLHLTPEEVRQSGKNLPN